MSRHATILLVNDTRDEREMYAEWLQHSGYCTLQAGTAADGLRMAVELEPDVVVTDIMLPGEMDGLALTESLKSDTTTVGMPVIVLTGCAFDSDRVNANRAGCDLFLTKPCLPEQLGQTIDELLRERRTIKRRHHHGKRSRCGRPDAVERVVTRRGPRHARYSRH